MQIFRYGSDVYGRKILEGASWDLIWVFFALGVIIILTHASYHWFFARKNDQHEAGGHDHE